MEHAKVYKLSAAFARQNGELDQYRESNRLNSECADYIKQAIREHYSNNRLYKAGADAALQEYGAERVQWVLAYTVQRKDYDGRFSDNNKSWANGFDIPDMDKQHYAVEAHPVLVDGFIRQTREALLRNEQELPAGIKREGMNQDDMKPGEYKYYSLHRPVSIGTFPREPKPDRIVNFDWRMPVEDGAFSAWGCLYYKQPLTKAQQNDYELAPSAHNPRERESVLEKLKEHNQSTKEVDAKLQQPPKRGIER